MRPRRVSCASRISRRSRSRTTESCCWTGWNGSSAKSARAPMVEAACALASRRRPPTSSAVATAAAHHARRARRADAACASIGEDVVRRAADAAILGRADASRRLRTRGRTRRRAPALAAGRTSSTDTRPAELLGHRRERVAVEAAGRDPLRERGRIEVDVQRVAVRRHPLARGGCRSRRSSAAAASSQTPVRPSMRRRLERERGERSDQRLFEVAAVLAHVLPVARQVEDRVADELARARGRSTCRRGRPRRRRRRRRPGTCTSPASARRPSVIVGGCSRKSTVSGAPSADLGGDRALELPAPRGSRRRRGRRAARRCSCAAPNIQRCPPDPRRRRSGSRRRAHRARAGSSLPMPTARS